MRNAADAPNLGIRPSMRVRVEYNPVSVLVRVVVRVRVDANWRGEQVENECGWE